MFRRKAFGTDMLTFVANAACSSIGAVSQIVPEANTLTFGCLRKPPLEFGRNEVAAFAFTVSSFARLGRTFTKPVIFAIASAFTSVGLIRGLSEI